MSLPRVGRHPSLHKLWCTAGPGEFVEHLQEGWKWNLWFISVPFSPAWGWVPRKIPVSGPAPHPIGVLSKVMAAHTALVFCRAPWCGLQGEQKTTQGCEIRPGICLSQLPREGRRCLFHYSLKAATNSESNQTSPVRDMAVWASKITCWQGPKRESELSPIACWKGGFSVLKGPGPQTESLLHLTYTSVSSPCQSLVGRSSPR